MIAPSPDSASSPKRLSNTRRLAVVVCLLAIFAVALTSTRDAINQALYAATATKTSTPNRLAAVRVINTLDWLGEVEVRIVGKRRVAKLPANAASEYLTVQPGSVSLVLQSKSGALSGVVDLEPGSTSTAVYVPDPSTGLGRFVLVADNTLAASTQSSIRVVDALNSDRRRFVDVNGVKYISSMGAISDEHAVDDETATIRFSGSARSGLAATLEESFPAVRHVLVVVTGTTKPDFHAFDLVPVADVSLRIKDSRAKSVGPSLPTLSVGNVHHGGWLSSTLSIVSLNLLLTGTVIAVLRYFRSAAQADRAVFFALRGE